MKVQIDNKHLVLSAETYDEAKEIAVLSNYTNRHAGFNIVNGIAEKYQMLITLHEINQTILRHKMKGKNNV